MRAFPSAVAWATERGARQAVRERSHCARWGNRSQPFHPVRVLCRSPRFAGPVRGFLARWGGTSEYPTSPLVPCPTAGWDDGGGRPQAPEEKLPNANGWRPTGRLKAALITRRGCPQTIPSPAQREGDVSLLLIAISVHACVHALSSKHSCGGKELFIQMHFCLFVVRLSLLCCCCLLAWHLHALDQAAALLTTRGVLLWVLLAVGAQGLSRFTCLAQPHGLNPCQEKWKNLVQPGLEKTARTVCD